jgi:hypothetical protein
MELLGGEFLEVLRPIRQHRATLVKEHELKHAVELAAAKLTLLAVSDTPGLVLILIDGDSECPGELGPRILAHAQNIARHLDIICVIACVEYETWFAAAAESLTKYLSFETVPDDPERWRLAKGWVERHFRGTRYSESVDQAAMTATMDLVLCRRRSPSFDKLCRELERRLNSTRNEKT